MTVCKLQMAILGFALLFLSPLSGITALSLVAVLSVGSTIRVMKITWNQIRRKRIFLGYPFFKLTSSFSMGARYSAGPIVILARKVQGEEIKWENV